MRFFNKVQTLKKLTFVHKKVNQQDGNLLSFQQLV